SNTIVHAMLDLARREGPTPVIGHLEQLLSNLDSVSADDRRGDWWQLNSTAASHVSGEVMEGFLRRVRDALPYVDAIQRYADSWGIGGSVAFGDPEFWVSLRLPAEQSLALVRDLLVYDYCWGWRPKDWAQS